MSVTTWEMYTELLTFAHFLLNCVEKDKPYNKDIKIGMQHILAESARQ